MQSTRRGVIGAIGIVSTAGCSGLLAGDGGSDGSDSTLRGRSIKQVSETFDLQRGDHRAYTMQFTEQTILFYSVVANMKVDVIVFLESHYDEYRRGATEKIQYISELSDLGTTATARGSAISAGNPVLVIDNTAWAEAPPVANLTVEVDVDAFVRAD